MYEDESNAPPPYKEMWSYIRFNDENGFLHNGLSLFIGQY